ncbi:MAG TPA: biotin/lipoyl-containing protein, partial [Thermoanaerobaculia bacterium]|nr:biotin/lipoyl-containing protein [Thermoanaerobaculia bacterium]
MGELIMPKAGDAMTEGKVVKWYKQPGDAVKKGEPVAEIETDKVNLDLEAEDDGTLGAHAAKEGDMVPVGGVLARILAEGEKDEAPADEKKADEPAEKKAEPTEEEPQRRSTDKKESVKHTTGEYHEAIEQRGPRRDRSTPETQEAAPEPSKEPSKEPGERPRSSPLARRMAREMGVSLEGVQGSGPRGRIVAAD